MNYSVLKFFSYSILTFIFTFDAWATKNDCEEIKIIFYSQADRLIQEIEEVELCAKPAEGFRDKVFSNLKYRANRLKTCVQMVKQGKLGFDCSREFRKTMKADGGESCTSEFGFMKKSFKNFETIFSNYRHCFKSKTKFYFGKKYKNSIFFSPKILD